MRSAGVDMNYINPHLKPRRAEGANSFKGLKSLYESKL